MPYIKVDATLINKTDKTLTLVTQSQHLDHGEWTTLAPPSVDPHDIAEWMSESDGFATGTEGRLNYLIDGEPETNTVWCYWDDPFSGDNKYNASAPPGYKVTFKGSTDGTDAVVVYKLEKG